MKAAFQSKCAICGDDIREGDEIKLLVEEGEDGGDWVHEECWEDEHGV